MITLQKLQSRARALAQVRDFFYKESILEVDCPALSKGANLDAFITPFKTTSGHYLHTSPEYGMKRLLASGAPDIFQLSHVFRSGEAGSRHNPEFTMLEWYRLGYSLQQMIQETCHFLKTFLEIDKVCILTYEQAWKAYTGHTYDLEEIHRRLQHKLQIDATPQETIPLAFAEEIEVHFPQDTLTVISHFPASQAALAQIEGKHALRFEVFAKGYEVANGYKELIGRKEHEERFEALNLPYPKDESFLSCLDQLPNCSGVAVGFERLMMIRENTSDIREILPIHWEES